MIINYRYKLYQIIKYATIALGLLSTVAQAAPPPQQNNQVPGYYRMKLGDFEITALYDGYTMIGNELLKGASQKDIQALLISMFAGSANGTQTAVNSYLVNTGKNLILIDTGAGKCFGPTLGRITNNIEAAGYKTSQVDTILLTHLHADHYCGLVDNDGKARFPDATIYTAKTEADYWLDEKSYANYPEGYKNILIALMHYIDADKFKSFNNNEEFLPGIKIVDTAGHTPGHRSYLLTSQNQSLLILGDLVHSYAVQFPNPDIALEFDTDQKQAVATRKKVFADAAKQRLWVAGAHLPFPGIGHVRAEQTGYSWVPIEYSPVSQ